VQLSRLFHEAASVPPRAFWHRKPVGGGWSSACRACAEIVQALKDLETKALLEKQAMQTVGNSPEDFAAFIKLDIAVWKDVATQANVEVKQAGFRRTCPCSNKNYQNRLTTRALTKQRNNWSVRCRTELTVLGFFNRTLRGQAPDRLGSDNKSY
jgi:hypothetical protein